MCLNLCVNVSLFPFRFRPLFIGFHKRRVVQRVVEVGGHVFFVPIEPLEAAFGITKAFTMYRKL